MKKKRTYKRPSFYYTLIDVLQASPTEPLTEERIRHQLTRMYGGLRSLETAQRPSEDDWRVCSDAVNILETLIIMRVVQDENCLLNDAVAALAAAGNRHQKDGSTIRLDAAGIKAVRSVLEDYASIIKILPARTMIQAHRLTEKRIQEIFAGKAQLHDVKIIKQREIQ